MGDRKIYPLFVYTLRGGVMKRQKTLLYRQSVVLTKEMKEVLDEYCQTCEMPKSNFIRYAIFKEIANSGKVWKDKITWKDW